MNILAIAEYHRETLHGDRLEFDKELYVVGVECERWRFENVDETVDVLHVDEFQVRRFHSINIKRCFNFMILKLNNFIFEIVYLSVSITLRRRMRTLRAGILSETICPSRIMRNK